MTTSSRMCLWSVKTSMDLLRRWMCVTTSEIIWWGTSTWSLRRRRTLTRQWRTSTTDGSEADQYTLSWHQSQTSEKLAAGEIQCLIYFWKFFHDLLKKFLICWKCFMIWWKYFMICWKKYFMVCYHRQYETGECTRSGFCNFMHLKPISRKLRSELYGRNRRGQLRGSGSPIVSFKRLLHILQDLTRAGVVSEISRMK